MASFDCKWYGPGLAACLSGSVDLNTDTFKMMFTDSSHTPNPDHDFRDDIEADEVTGTGLSAGGVTLDNPTVTYTSGTNTVKVDVDDEVISGVTASDIKNLHIYKSRGGASSADELIFYGIATSAISPAGGDLTITFDSAGLSAITV
jgi:hypothetical protein